MYCIIINAKVNVHQPVYGVEYTISQLKFKVPAKSDLCEREKNVAHPNHIIAS